jgi:AcrR family transcriptional regulator
MTTKPKAQEIEPDTKEKLLEAAAQVFSERGFGGATVKEIAELAGVNVSLISYHFNGKEGLFRTIVENFGRERLRDAEKILSPPDSIEDLRAKLRLWCSQFLACHVEQDNVCSILHRENVWDQEFLWDIFQGTFLKQFEAIVKFFEAARKKGIIRKDVDALMATTTIFGTLIHIGRSQKIQQKWMNVSIADEKYRGQVTDQILNVLFNGIAGSPS